MASTSAGIRRRGFAEVFGGHLARPLDEDADSSFLTAAALYGICTERLATPRGLAALRAEILARHPERGFDFTFLRKAVLRELAVLCDCPADELVEHGFNQFWQARNRVELFADVRPVLGALRERYTLIALTNLYMKRRQLMV